MSSTRDFQVERDSSLIQNYGDIDEVMALENSDNDLKMLSGSLSVRWNGTTGVPKAIVSIQRLVMAKDGIQRPTTFWYSLRRNSFFLRMITSIRSKPSMTWWMEASRKTCCLAASRCPLSNHVQARGVGKFVRAASRNEEEFDRSVAALLSFG